MSDIEMTHEKKSVESLPANSSWGKFFLAMYFGRNYFRFSGRASRKEYWGAPILANVFMFLIILAASATGVFSDAGLNVLSNLMSIYCIIPGFALMSRRFHDINMRAWWGVLVIPLFFLPFFKGDRKDNKFGKNIYGEE